MKKLLLIGLVALAGIGGLVMAANFPTSVSTDTNLYVAVNNCYTTLSTTINASTPTINAASTTNFPASGAFIIENEVIKYAAKTSNSFTGCTRGFDGTASAAHTAGKLIYASIIAAHHNVLKDEVKAIEDFLVGSGTDLHVNTTLHRVGIGNASPTQALDVTGSGNFSGSLVAASSVGGASGSFTGEVAAGTLNTGHGSNELYPMDQDIRTTAYPWLAGLNLTYGLSASTVTGSGLGNFGSLKVGTGGNAGYVLTDVSGDGNGTWSAPTTLLSVGATISGADANGVLYNSGDQLMTSAGFTFDGSTLTTPGLLIPTGAQTNYVWTSVGTGGLGYWAPPTAPLAMGATVSGSAGNRLWFTNVDGTNLADSMELTYATGTETLHSTQMSMTTATIHDIVWNPSGGNPDYFLHESAGNLGSYFNGVKRFAWGGGYNQFRVPNGPYDTTHPQLSLLDDQTTGVSMSSTTGITAMVAGVPGAMTVGTLKVGTGGNAGYVLTDVSGDGNYSPQAPTGGSGGGSSVYPATATAVFPFGLDISSGVAISSASAENSISNWVVTSTIQGPYSDLIGTEFNFVVNGEIAGTSHVFFDQSELTITAKDTENSTLTLDNDPGLHYLAHITQGANDCLVNSVSYDSLGNTIVTCSDVVSAFSLTTAYASDFADPDAATADEVGAAITMAAFNTIARDYIYANDDGNGYLQITPDSQNPVTVYFWDSTYSPATELLGLPSGTQIPAQLQIHGSDPTEYQVGSGIRQAYLTGFNIQSDGTGSSSIVGMGAGNKWIQAPYYGSGDVAVLISGGPGGIFLDGQVVNIGNPTNPLVTLTQDGYGTQTSTFRGGMSIGNTYDGTLGDGTLNVAVGIYKDSTAFTNPDYALEKWATGKVEKFKANPGAADYPGRMSLPDLEAFMRKNYELPRVGAKKEGFDRMDVLLEKLEEAYTYIVDLNKRLDALEGKAATPVQTVPALVKTSVVFRPAVAKQTGRQIYLARHQAAIEKLRKGARRKAKPIPTRRTPEKKVK